MFAPRPVRVALARRWAWAVVAALVLLAPRARAQAYDPSWGIELFQTPVWSATRSGGMGGASVGVAEGSGTIIANPAAAANRFFCNGEEYFDWDVSLAALAVGAGGRVGIDLENNGRTVDKDEQASLGALSLGLNFGRLGLGLVVTGQEYAVCAVETAAACGAGELLRYSAQTVALAGAWVLSGGEWVAGASITTSTAQIDLGGKQVVPAYVDGGGLGLGLLWRPRGGWYRVGASLRTVANPTRPGAGDGAVVGGRLVPDRLVVPWELSVGGALGWGPRPLNLEASFGDDEAAGDHHARYARHYHLVALDVGLRGPSDHAVDVDAWLVQRAIPSGERVTPVLRAGYENELWPDSARLRAGSYLELSRVATVPPRVHGTLGFDLRLFDFIWQWKLTGLLDAAPRFLNVGLSIGLWH